MQKNEITRISCEIGISVCDAIQYASYVFVGLIGIIIFFYKRSDNYGQQLAQYKAMEELSKKTDKEIEAFRELIDRKGKK